MKELLGKTRKIAFKSVIIWIYKIIKGEKVMAKKKNKFVSAFEQFGRSFLLPVSYYLVQVLSKGSGQPSVIQTL